MRAVVRSYIGVALATTAATAATAVPAPAHAQRVAELRPAGVVAPSLHDSATSLTTATPGPAERPVVVRAARRKPLMPYFVLGGAVTGAGSIVGLAAVNCRGDDGGGCWSLVPPFTMVAALGGAIVGGLVGAVVDLDRRHPAAREAVAGRP